MLILVTGAAGRIGVHLTRALIGRGHTVRALVLAGDPRVNEITGPGTEVVHGRLEDAKTMVTVARGVDAVYHLGGALTSRGHTDEQFFDYNLRGTFNLLMAVRHHAPEVRRLVYASSDAVYWKGSEPAAFLPADETHPRLAGTVYGATKIGAEEMCLAFSRGFGIPITVLRFGPTAEPWELVDPRSVFARWLFLRAARDLLAALAAPTPEQVEAQAILDGLDDGSDRLVALADRAGEPEVRQWADARDIANGCARVLDTPAAIGETFNLGGVAPHTSEELVRYLAARTGHSSVAVRLPTPKVAWYISSAKARAILGYQPRHSVFDMVDQALSSPRAR